MPTADEIMARMGFQPDDPNPHVAGLRTVVDRQISEGLQNRSYGSWAPGNHSDEVRAKALLEADWEIQHGHCCEVKCMDGFFGRSYNRKTKRTRTWIDWKYLAPWLGDRCREVVMHGRIWRDRLMGVRNPYR